MSNSQIYRMIMFLMLFGFLSSCKIGSPFKMISDNGDPGDWLVDGKPLLLVITYIETGSDRKKNRLFWKHVRNVYNTMGQHHGLIGYAVRREVFGKKGWTMSVWKDEESKNKFVYSEPHREAMKNGLPALTKTIFASALIEPDQLPPSWSNAEKILSEHARDYER